MNFICVIDWFGVLSVDKMSKKNSLKHEFERIHGKFTTIIVMNGLGSIVRREFEFFQTVKGEITHF